jgi:hypothetical protein
MEIEKEKKGRSLDPTTTEQEDITTAGQRKVNLIWEYTQAAVALLVTITFLYCEVMKIDSLAVKMGFSLIVGFYFSRTNHSAIGGVGRKPYQQYQGR